MGVVIGSEFLVSLCVFYKGSNVELWGEEWEGWSWNGGVGRVGAFVVRLGGNWFRRFLLLLLLKGIQKGCDWFEAGEVVLGLDELSYCLGD